MRCFIPRGWIWFIQEPIFVLLVLWLKYFETFVKGSLHFLLDWFIIEFNLIIRFWLVNVMRSKEWRFIKSPDAATCITLLYLWDWRIVKYWYSPHWFICIEQFGIWIFFNIFVNFNIPFGGWFAYCTRIGIRLYSRMNWFYACLTLSTLFWINTRSSMP